MEFLDYIKNRKRMFDSIGRKNGYCVGVDCSRCQDLIKEKGCFNSMESGAPEKAELIVQRWAEKNPIITNAVKFEKEWGKKPINADGVYLCPVHFTSINCNASACDDCLKWWEEEYIQPRKPE